MIGAQTCTLGAYVDCYLYDIDGNTVASSQLPIPASWEHVAQPAQPLELNETQEDYVAEGDGFRYAISKHYGQIRSIIAHGQEQLKAPVQLTVMRAPTDNERKVRGMWYKDTGDGRAEGLDRLFHKCYSCTSSGNTVTVEAAISGISRVPLLRYRATYSFYTDGNVKVTLDAQVREVCFWLPRLGFEFHTNAQTDAFRYYGRGPWENYCDMFDHARVDWHESNADREYVPYIMPQEHGNHMDVKVLQMDGGLTFRSDEAFCCNVSHYSALQLMRAKHTDELKKEDVTIIRIDCRSSGLGSHSCGPELPEKYRFSEKKVEKFNFWIGV